MSDEIFLQPRLTGKRFEGGAIPLELLRDIAVFEELLIEVAKSRFLDENPGRKRVRRGFLDEVSLKITGIEDGSAKPIIKLITASALLFAEATPYLEDARDAIISAISAAETGSDPLEFLPTRAFAYFDRFGRSLRENESIDFTKKDGGTAKLNQETRRTLVLSQTGVNEITEGVVLYGAVCEADVDAMSFHVKLLDGHRVKGPIAREHIHSIVDALAKCKSGGRIRLQGVGRFTRMRKLQAVDSVEHITALDALDVPARLAELKHLRNDWLYSGSPAPSHAGLNWLSAAFESSYSADLPLPHLYPTETGGVRAEWSIKDREVSLEVDLETHTGDWHVWNATNEDTLTDAFHLDEEESWQAINTSLRAMSEKA